MGKRCVAAGCRSTHKKGVHLYSFPKDPTHYEKEMGRSSRKDNLS